jgi:hypothetical protein
MHFSLNWPVPWSSVSLCELWRLSPIVLPARVVDDAEEEKWRFCLWDQFLYKRKQFLLWFTCLADSLINVLDNFDGRLL